MIERNIARIALPKMLVGLFVAPFADYGEYERWNSNAHTSCFGVRMPQASEVAVSRSRNGQYHFGFVSAVDVWDGPSGFTLRVATADRTG